MFEIPQHLLPPGFTDALQPEMRSHLFQHDEELPVKLLWLDFETTGLNTLTDHLLEVAVRFTDVEGGMEMEPTEDYHLGFNTVIAAPWEVLDRIRDPWILNTHEELLKMAKDPHRSLPFYLLDRLLCSWLVYYGSTVKKPTIHLAGNSVWFDRAFLTRHLPNAAALLHYRQIDVSSLQEFLLGLFPNDPHLVFEKKKAHRALLDVEESIAQYRHYRQYLRKLKGPPKVMVDPSLPQPAPEGELTSFEVLLNTIRSKGWVVGVHNDYRLHGRAHTFWLFTKDGMGRHGEGTTDAIALQSVLNQIEALEPAASRKPLGPMFINYYNHCGESWVKMWEAGSHDPCPACSAMIVPTSSKPA